VDNHNRAEAFIKYASARRDYLRRTAYLMCGDWHGADDLVQTALVKLYVAWPKIRSRGTEDAYARRVIVRAYLDEKRRPWRREYVGLDGFDHAAPHEGSVEDRHLLIDALATLPARQRAAVVLRYWCDLSVGETAEVLRCSTGAVKSQSARGLEKLRTALSSSAFATERETQ
jgi:RNA polymerase sigma-70 factor (sigma-E family)